MRFIVGPDGRHNGTVSSTVSRALCIDVGSAHADRRVALVIGNGTYTKLPDDQELKTAVNDRLAAGAALARPGFEVIEGKTCRMRRSTPGSTN